MFGNEGVEVVISAAGSALGVVFCYVQIDENLMQIFLA